MAVEVGASSYRVRNDVLDDGRREVLVTRTELGLASNFVNLHELHGTTGAKGSVLGGRIT